MSESIKDLHVCKRKKISELSMLSCGEQEQIKEQFNNTFADYPRDKCVHQLFEDQASKFPTKVALKFDGKEFTHQELSFGSCDIRHFKSWRRISAYRL